MNIIECLVFIKETAETSAEKVRKRKRDLEMGEVEEEEERAKERWRTESSVKKMCFEINKTPNIIICPAVRGSKTII